MAKRPQRGTSGGRVRRKAPALTRAVTIGRRAARAGFDWPDVAGVLAKLDEETRELKEELAGWDFKKKRQRRSGRPLVAHEIGDMLFVLTNLARHTGVDPESALDMCMRRFCRRFEAMCDIVAAEGRRLDSLTLAELDRAWEAAKNGLRKKR